MQKIILLIVILAWQNLCWAVPQTNADDSDRLSAEQLAAAETEFALWFNQLNEQLLESKDNYAKVMGLAAIINGTLNINNNTAEPIDITELLESQGLALNKIISQDDLSEATLDLLATWCFRPQLKQLCDQDTLINHQLKQHPDNLNVYLMPLQIAFEQENLPLMKQIIERMSEAKRSHHTHYITSEFNQVIDDYILKNPIPASYVSGFKDDKALLADLPLEKKPQIDSLINAYFPTSIKMSYVFLNDTPTFGPLYKVCKSDPNSYPFCLKIIQVLINQSNSIVAKGVGYSTLMAMHEVNGKTELYEIVKEKQEAFKAKIQCLAKASQTGSFAENFLDPEYQKINLQPIDELERQQQLADYVFSKYKADNPDLKDPEGC